MGNKKINLFGYEFESSTMSEILQEIKTIVKENRKVHLHTVNVDHIVIAQRDCSFDNIIKNADLVVADGMPIVWLSKLKKRGIPERVTGIDLSKELCALSSTTGFKLFFLGAAEGVAAEAKKNMENIYPGVNIVGHYSPTPNEINNESSSLNIVHRINESGANILLVALGAPRQEFWISKYFDELNTNLNIGVGATLDFLANNVKRAPKWMQNSGLEWLFRIIQEPKRMIKRYIIQDFVFFKLAIKEVFQRKYESDKL